MCDPVIGLMVASTVVSTIGGVQASKAQQASLRYAGKVDDINAQAADRAARDAIDRGDQEAVAHGRKVAALRGEQTARMAASGIELGFGSPLDVATDTDLLAAEDNRRIHENANREAQGYRLNAANYRASATGNRAAASAAKSSMYINAGSTILSGATQMAKYKAKTK